MLGLLERAHGNIAFNQIIEVISTLQRAFAGVVSDNIVPSSIQHPRILNTLVTN